MMTHFITVPLPQKYLDKKKANTERRHMECKGVEEEEDRSEARDQRSEVGLTNGGHGLLPPSEQTWFSSQTSALQSTSSTW